MENGRKRESQFIGNVRWLGSRTLLFSSLPGTRWMMVLARCTPTRFMSTTDDKSACEMRGMGKQHKRLNSLNREKKKWLWLSYVLMLWSR